MKKAVASRYTCGKNFGENVMPRASSDATLSVVSVTETPKHHHKINTSDINIPPLKLQKKIIDSEPKKVGRVIKLENTYFTEDRELSVSVISATNEEIFNTEREEEEINRKLAKLELEQLADGQKRDALRMMEKTTRDENAITLRPRRKEIVKEVFTDSTNEYIRRKLQEGKRLKRVREEQESVGEKSLIIKKMRTLCEEKCGIRAQVNPKMIGKYKFLQRYRHSSRNTIADVSLENPLEKPVKPKTIQVKSFGRGGQESFKDPMDEDKTPWIVFKYKIYN